MDNLGIIPRLFGRRPAQFGKIFESAAAEEIGSTVVKFHDRRGSCRLPLAKAQARPFFDPCCYPGMQAFGKWMRSIAHPRQTASHLYAAVRRNRVTDWFWPIADLRASRPTLRHIGFAFETKIIQL
jgi:hypothetical protein